MSPLDPLGPLLAQIRAQALAWKRKASGPAASSGREEVSAAGPTSPADVFASIRIAVAAIPSALPDRRRRAFRLYLQAVLARELGVQDPSATGFQELVQRVQSSMEGDDTLRAAIDRAGEVLLQRSET